MGPVLGPIFSFIGAMFVGPAAGATLFGSAAAYAFAVNVARIAALALIAKATAPKMRLDKAAFEKLITVRDTLAAQTFTYGEDLVSGPLLFADASGTDNKDLYFLVAIAGHEIDSIQRYKVDDIWIELSELSGAYTGTIGAGTFDGVGEIDARLGTSTQTVYTSLNTQYPSLWTAAHTGRGWASVLFRFSIVEGKEDVFQAQPRNCRALIRGYKVYDPRLDSTQPGGSGAHRVDDDTTWEWSTNPALCLAHFIIDTKFGLREDTDRVDWSMVMTAADVCDESVTVPAPVNTQKRYTCNGTFTSAQPRREVRDALLDAMMGRLVFSQGVWRMWAGEAVTPDVTITQEHLAGSIQLQASAGAKERYNRVRGNFVDPSRDYTANPYVEQRSSVYEADDGDEVREEIYDQPATQDGFEAQRKAIIKLKQSRNQRVVVFEGNLSCFRIQTGSTVLLDIDEYGFASEKFFVSEWAFSEDGVQLTLVQETDSVWADPLVGDYSTRTETGVIVFGNTGVPAPTSLTAVSQLYGVLLEWTDPPANLFAHIEIWVSYDNDRANAILLDTTPTTPYLDSISNIARSRYYWIRAIDDLGRISAWEPDLTTTTAFAYPQIQEADLVPDPFVRLGSSFWVFDDTNARYAVGEGTNGTDALEIDGDETLGTGVEAIQRRGPEEWDLESFHKQVLEIHYRVRIKSEGVSTTWSVGVRPWLVVTDADGVSNRKEYGSLDYLVLNPTDNPEGVWFDWSSTIEIDDELSETPPRYINVRFEVIGVPINGIVFQVDYVSGGVYGNKLFEGAGKTGYVPDPVTETGLFLQDDGTWSNPLTSSDFWHIATQSPYNADNSGATQTAADIQVAIDAAETAGGGVVYLPEGVYLLEQSIILKDMVSIRGSGRRSTILKLDANVDDAVLRFATTGEELEGITLSHFQINGNRANQTIVTAGSFSIGVTYVILSVGTTDFTAIGATTNVVGQAFTATGAGSGTGTARTEDARGIYLDNITGSTTKSRHHIHDLYITGCHGDGIFFGDGMVSNIVSDIVLYLNSGNGIKYQTWSDNSCYDIDVGQSDLNGILVTGGTGVFHMSNVKSWFSDKNNFRFDSAGVIGSNLESQEGGQHGFVITGNLGRVLELSSCQSDADNRENTIVHDAGTFVIGYKYEIVTAGTTDFTAIGAADNNVGTQFTATGIGSGTGTARGVTTYNGMLISDSKGGNISLTVTNRAQNAGPTKNGVTIGYEVSDLNLDLRCQIDPYSNDDGLLPGGLPVTGAGVGNCSIRVNGQPYHFQTFEDEFAGPVIGEQWKSWIGTDNNALPPSLRPGAVGGALRIVTGNDAGGTMATNGSLVVTEAMWRPSNEGLSITGRFRTSSNTDVAYFFGFTDDADVLEMPFTLSGTTLTSNATDACGVLFDSAATSSNYQFVGVDTDVDATRQDTGIAADTEWHEFRITFNSNGAATLWYNGVRIGTQMVGAVEGTTLLTPVLAAFSRGAATRSIDLEHIHITQLRRPA